MGASNENSDQKNVIDINQGQARNGNGNGGNYDNQVLQRLTRVETRMEGLATKADLANFKADLYKALWVQSIAVIVAIVVALIKTFFT